MSEGIFGTGFAIAHNGEEKMGIWVFVWTFIIHWAFTYSSLQIACTVDDFLLLLYFKLFHLLLLQRGQATTRVVYNIKFMSRWYSFNLYMQGKITGVSTSIEVYVILHVAYYFHWCNSRTRTNVHLAVNVHYLWVLGFQQWFFYLITYISLTQLHKLNVN